MTLGGNVMPKRIVREPRKPEPWTCKCGIDQHPGLRRCGTCGESRP